MVLQRQEGAGSGSRLLDLAALRLEAELSEAHATTPRNYGWLGDHQDEAAELAALLHEAAPKLALASLRRALPAGARPLPKARSYEVSDTIKDRLRAAEPMPTGPGQVPWSHLAACISSELLKLDDISDVAAAAANGCVSGPAASPRSPAAPAGDVLEINSGGRVFFCLFDTASPAPTPPCSLRNSPERGMDHFMGRAAVAAAAVAGSSTAGTAVVVQQGTEESILAQGLHVQPGSGEDSCRQLARELSLVDRSFLSSPQKGAQSLSAADALLALQEERARADELTACGGGDEVAAAAAYAAAAAAERKLAELQMAACQQQQQLGQEHHHWQPPSYPGSISPSPNSSPTHSTSSSDQPLDATALASLLPQSSNSFSFASASTTTVPGAAVAAGAALAVPRQLRWSTAGGYMGQQSCLVLKFVSSRLLCQSEQFASELTRHVGLCAPDSRILRSKGSTEAEWQEALEAAAAMRDRFPDLHEEMSRASCCLVMEFIPGGSLFRSRQAFQPPQLLQTAQDLGRLFTLDMLLGNADRLHCDELAWRGNPENILYASAGRWAGRPVAIDAVVQRRPPGGLKSVEDRSCERLTELALNDSGVAGSLLRQAMQPADGTAEVASLPETAAAFQQGLKAALDAAVSIKGLLEMMFEVVTEWIHEFIEDIEMAEGGSGGGGGSASAGGVSLASAGTPRSQSASRRVSSAGAATSPLLLASPNSTSAQTMRIRQISHEAQRNDSVGEKVAHWKAVFREKGEELRAAVEEWQQKRGTPAGGQRLTTAFLDGTHPIVDVYELKVRLEHMLQRLRVLQQATLTGRPCRLLPRLYLSGAVEASSHHLLKHMGITHVLNATEDLLLPEEDQGFVTMRCSLADLEEEDISPFLPEAAAFIDEGLAKGGGVLVHCHAGKSRSCSLVLAWLMTRRRWPLNRALEFVRRVRPEAAPNAGYLAALLRLEEELFGRQTVKMKKTKPEPRTCPECGERVGLSADSVRVHLRFKHPGSLLARSLQFSSQDSFSVYGRSSSWAELGSPRSPRSSTQLSSPRSASNGASDGGGGALQSPRTSLAAAAARRFASNGGGGGDGGASPSPRAAPSAAAAERRPPLPPPPSDYSQPQGLEQQKEQQHRLREEGKGGKQAPGQQQRHEQQESRDQLLQQVQRLAAAHQPHHRPVVPRLAGLAAERAGQGYLDSPSLSAVLQGEVADISLCVDDREEEEFLSVASPPKGAR